MIVDDDDDDVETTRRTSLLNVVIVFYIEYDSSYERRGILIYPAVARWYDDLLSSLVSVDQIKVFYKVYVQY